MKKNRKQRRIMFLLILILGITVGFALLSTTLYINGTANIKKNTWNIHWDDTSIVETPNSVTATTPANVTDQDKKNISFDVEFELPGDFYEFTADAVNEGSIDGLIDHVDIVFYKADGVTKYTNEDPMPTEIVYSFTHADGTAVGQNEIIKHGESISYKFRVGYNSESTGFPSSPVVVKPEITITPVQHKDEIPEPRTCAQFQTDSWSDIANYVSLKSDVYPLGCTRDVDLGSTYGVHAVRISNNTIPSECKTTGFSQSACGFVLEFTDVIVGHRMNPWDEHTTADGNGTKGSWEYSENRTLVNGDIYNALPSELKSVVIKTNVVTGHGFDDSSNFTTEDRLYLLSTKELYGKEGTSSVINKDSAELETRQLDYYADKGVTTVLNDKSTYVVKNQGNSSSYWWLRTPESDSKDDFFFVRSSGVWDVWYSYYGYGVSPAFRVGKQ